MEATSDRRATANSTAAIAMNFQKIRQPVSGYPATACFSDLPSFPSLFENQVISVPTKAATRKTVAHERMTMALIENDLR